MTVLSQLREYVDERERMLGILPWQPATWPKPHEYVAIRMGPDVARAIVEMRRIISREGETRPFMRWSFRYLEVGEWSYWISERGVVLNRTHRRE